jgi:hypothetical protein
MRGTFQIASGLFLATVGSAMLAASPAYAILQIAIDVNGVITTCADGAGCDHNLSTGQLELEDFTSNGVVFNGAFSINE